MTWHEKVTARVWNFTRLTNETTAQEGSPEPTYPEPMTDLAFTRRSSDSFRDTWTSTTYTAVERSDIPV